MYSVVMGSVMWCRENKETTEDRQVHNHEQKGIIADCYLLLQAVVTLMLSGILPGFTF